MKSSSIGSSKSLACGLALVIQLCGCSDRAGGAPSPRADGGITLSDSGTRDAGTVGATDAGGSAARDAGSVDAGRFDAGPRDADRTSCMAPPVAFPEADAPRCNATTRTRMVACAGEPVCIRTAAAEDTTPEIMRGTRSIDCQYCLSAQQKFCISTHGCETETQNLDCCIAESCPGGSCTMTTCSSTYSAYSTCATTIAAACLSDPVGGDFAVCFPPE